MDALNLTIKLNKLHCYDESDGPGDAKPYLWTVFFKVDEDTVTVTEKLGLQGTATVILPASKRPNWRWPTASTPISNLTAATPRSDIARRINPSATS
jgi:hypothetical protein